MAKGPIAGFEMMWTGFTGVLEKWHSAESNFDIIFILKSDPGLQAFWRTEFPDMYPMSVKRSKGPKIMMPRDERTLFVKLF